MNSFNFGEFDENSREVLKKVVEEIREQFLVNGRPHQFWFYPTQVSDTTLTAPIIQKWLQILSTRGVLHYYRPINGFDYEQALALGQGHLSDNHEWEQQILAPFITGFPPNSFPGFALDIYDTNLDQLIESVSRKTLFGKFQKDRLDRYSYGGVLLLGINNSPTRKAILEEFLLADGHTVSSEKIKKIISRFSDAVVDDGMKNDAISETKKALRKVTHEVDIVSHKSGRRVDYYELTSE